MLEFASTWRFWVAQVTAQRAKGKRDPERIGLPLEMLRAYLPGVFATASQVTFSLGKHRHKKALWGPILKEPLVDLEIQGPRQFSSAIVDIFLKMSSARVQRMRNGIA